MLGHEIDAIVFWNDQQLGNCAFTTNAQDGRLFIVMDKIDA
jgi:hypothetical protein